MGSISLVALLIVILYFVEYKISSNNLYNFSEDGLLTFTEIALKYGYPSAEERDIITEDGYILKLHHIPGDKARTILLIHGNTPTAHCWIARGKTSLAITLASRGYDVWAINLRGTMDSRRHLYLNPDTQPERFFNFTFYEQAVYDVPATIDHILSETGQEQLVAIGHSVGCTQLYVMGAEKPEYNKKIKVGISLAPICYLDHLRGLPALVPVLGPALLKLFEIQNTHEVAGRRDVESILKFVCLGPYGYFLCIQVVLFGVLGYDEQGLEPDFVPTLFGQFPGGSSLKTLKHLLQIMQNKNFTKYDFGRRGNLEVYKSPVPPQFDLSKVTMKTALFVGAEDFLATEQDSLRLNASLPNVVHFQLMPYKKFNHVDFVWGRYMTDNFFPFLFEVIEKYI